MEYSKITKNNGKLTIKLIEKERAKQICIENHYSKKWNSTFGIYNFGVFQNDNLEECLGVLVFGNMMNPSSYKGISEDLEKGNLIELNRMWLNDNLGKNAETTVMALCFKYMKHNCKEVKVIQTFADGRLGCGTVYKACNFDYYGYHETLFYENIKSGECFHKVTLENTAKLIPMIARNLVLCSGNLVTFKVKTYRYLYLLDKKINIKLKKQKYPEYNIGKDYVEITQSLSNLARVYQAINLMDDVDHYKKLVDSYINENYKTNKDELYKLAINSKTMIKYLNEDVIKTKSYLENGLIKYIEKENLVDYI